MTTTLMEPGEGLMMIPLDVNAPIVFPTTEEQLAGLEEKLAIDKMPTDLAVKENHELVRVSIAECRTVRTTVEKRRKEIVAPLVEYQRNVNQSAKDITSRIAAIEDPLKDRKKEHDDRVEIERREAVKKEEARVDAINLRMAEMGTLLAKCMPGSSSTVQAEIDKLEGDKLEWAEEFFPKADVIKIDVVVQLINLRDMKTESEEMQAAQKEREKKDAEEKERAAAQQKLDEERAAETERAAQKERDFLAAERQKEIDAHAAEIERQRIELKQGQDALAAETKAREEAEAARVRAQEAEEARIKKEAEDAELKQQQEAEEAKRKVQEEQRAKDKIVEEKRLAKESDRLRENRIAKTCGKLADAMTDYEVGSSLALTIVTMIIDGHFDHIKWVD